MPKVSVIMPVYNVEKYFCECLESVINQTLKDIEIIPVDDGSPDNCGRIMDEYASKDNRIKPIHKKNGGYGSAVNVGIAAATGEYIGIVETDDVIDSAMYEKLYNQAKKLDLDICKCGFNTYNSTKNDYEKIKKWQFDTQDIEKFPDDKSFSVTEEPRILLFHSSIWSNVYKREFLLKNNIKVNETRSASYQDLPFMAECMLKAEKIGVVHEYLYNWRREFGQDSSTERTDSRLMIMADQCEVTKKLTKDVGLYDELKEYLYYQFYCCCTNFYKVIDLEYKREFFDKLHKLFVELKNDNDFKFILFSKKEKKLLNNYINNKFVSGELCTAIRKFIIRLKFTKKEKYLYVMGKKII